MVVERRNIWSYDTDNHGVRTMKTAERIEEELRIKPLQVRARV